MARFKTKRMEHDLITGEVSVTTSTFTSKIKPRSFIMFFTSKEALSIKERIKGVIANRMLDIICRDVVFNGNYIDVSMFKRNEMQMELGISTSKFTGVRNELVASGAIYVDKSRYYLNHALYWRGDSNALQGLLDSLEDSAPIKEQ